LSVSAPSAAVWLESTCFGFSDAFMRAHPSTPPRA
jgi:hypothetical protein